MNEPSTLYLQYAINEPFPDRFIRICDHYTHSGTITSEDFNYFMEKITAYRRTLRWISKEVSSREIPLELKYVVCQAAAESVLSDK